MTDMEQDLRALLLNNAGVAALVSTRVYPGVLPGDPTLPAIVYHEIAGFDAELTFSGSSGVINGTVQLDLWATTYAGAKALKSAVLAAIAGKSSGKIHQIRVNLMLDDYEPETKYFRQLIDAQVTYRWGDT